MKEVLDTAAIAQADTYSLKRVHITHPMIVVTEDFTSSSETQNSFTISSLLNRRVRKRLYRET